MNLSILSQNIWNKNYYWEKRKPLIVGLIKEFEPDIIAIQEIVGKSIQDNQLTEIASKLNCYKPVFTLVKKVAGKVYGLGLLSKYKVTQTKIFKLRLDPKEKEDTFLRVLIYHKVQVKEKSLDIFHTHLCFGRIGRQLNIKEAIKYISHFDHNKYTIFIGDFNASPSDGSIKQFLNHKFKNKKFNDLGTITKNNSPTWPIPLYGTPLCGGR